MAEDRFGAAGQECAGLLSERNRHLMSGDVHTPVFPMQRAASDHSFDGVVADRSRAQLRACDPAALRIGDHCDLGVSIARDADWITHPKHFHEVRVLICAIRG
jgi:hypothetical protein